MKIQIMQIMQALRTRRWPMIAQPFALKGKDAVTNYDIQNYEKELGHLTKLSQDSLGKNSITTRNAVEASRAAYNKAVEKEKKDAARVQAIKTKAGAEKKKGGRKIVRQANFRAQAPGSRETGQVTRKKRPTKRDRSINSDLRVQQAYAPIAKVVGHGAPVHPQAIPGGWGLGDPYHNPYIPGQSSMYSDQTCAFGFDEGHYGQMGGAQDVSAALEGGYQYNTSSSNKNNILPGMVRPAPELDIPITAFRGALPAHKGSQGGFPDIAREFSAADAERGLWAGVSEEHTALPRGEERGRQLCARFNILGQQGPEVRRTPRTFRPTRQGATARRASSTCTWRSCLSSTRQMWILQTATKRAPTTRLKRTFLHF
ncbi:AP2-like ethylene-responsive transcription factor [Chloropicon roscoffensis]|uniref:AP2-like ethylene-responsive transcription factor n=1 Tax=Chloropicon roscoffensis TaxID=1461544 RepID=A0AAX4P2N1_9CHLO